VILLQSTRFYEDHYFLKITGFLHLRRHGRAFAPLVVKTSCIVVFCELKDGLKNNKRTVVFVTHTTVHCDRRFIYFLKLASKALVQQKIFAASMFPTQLQTKNSQCPSMTRSLLEFKNRKRLNWVSSIVLYTTRLYRASVLTS